MIPDTVNWHITYDCNYRCSFCFFRSPTGESLIPSRMGISFDEAVQLIDALGIAGVKRINFAGGEPTLVKEFSHLVTMVKRRGLQATVVTNGTGLTPLLLDRIASKISAIKLSIDSPSDNTESQLGRGDGHHVSNIKRVVVLARERNIPLMANTVVTSLNYKEDMHPIIYLINPRRWKVFQVLPIQGQNMKEYEILGITKEQFDQFVRKHSDIPEMVPENNDLMTQSYAMIDPFGRFFQNTGSKYTVSGRIVDIGVETAFAQLNFDYQKYKGREIGNLFSGK